MTSVFLHKLIAGVLPHQIECRFLLCEALDLLHLLPQKAPSETPSSCRIVSPEIRPTAAVFHRFRPTRCVPAVNYLSPLLPSSLRVRGNSRKNFPCNETTISSLPESRRCTARLRPHLVAVPGRGRPRHHCILFLVYSYSSSSPLPSRRITGVP